MNPKNLLFCFILIFFGEILMAQNLANQLPNASFEKVNPAGWERKTWGGKAEFGISEAGREGGKSITLASETGANAAWFSEVAVYPNFNYKLSGWIKTDNIVPRDGKGCQIVLDFDQDKARIFKGSNDWTYTEFLFNSGDRESVKVYCLLGGWGNASGKVWFDDLNLEPIATERKLEIDVTKTSEPISQYIYGQFIEHLGRCIYGGIWAEMLEDRKFYYPINDSYAPWGSKSDPDPDSKVIKPIVASPWKTIGSAGTVSMDITKPFVGEHSPVVALSGDGTFSGISQEGLALVKGHEYDGRIILAGDPQAAPIEINLFSGNKKIRIQKIENISLDFKTYPFSFLSPQSSENGVLEIGSRGIGRFRIGTVSLMPADNIKGFRPDVIQLLKELDSPIYRWPGGNFVSGYNWKDGIGERDKRPPRKNPAWTGVEHNDVGIHEYMDLMELIRAEPFIAVNTGLGTVEEVAAEVEYCNGSSETKMGKLRAQNGHPEPFKVKWWAVGNEMYGDWQLGHMPLNEYVKKHNAVADAMWEKDPGIKLVGVGEVGKWSETMLRESGDHMTLLSEHIYCQEKAELWEHVKQLAEQIRKKANAHRLFREQISGLKDKDIRIAMDEWNYWYGKEIYGELGVRYYHKDALGVAIGLHEYFRNSDIYFMANYAQTVNVIGAIKATRTHSSFATTGLVLKLYRQHFGTIPIAAEFDLKPLDIFVAWTADRKTLTVAIVNPSHLTMKMPVNISSVKFTGKGKKWIILGEDPMSYNEPGEKQEVIIQEEEIRKFEYEIVTLPFSITLLSLEVK